METKMEKDSITTLKSLHVINFRGLKDIKIHFGKRLTVICGRNGMLKSSILGIVAQIFNFATDYTVDDENRSLDFKTISGDKFKSKLEEHFRLSAYDKNEKYRIDINLYDGAEKIILEKLRLTFSNTGDRAYPRPVVRNNSTRYTSNSSRNVTHPVIFLSVKRLLPITEREYHKINNKYIFDNKKELSAAIRDILTREDLSELTATSGTINSMVGHTENYDYQSVSVGDDNVGQIVQSLFSFKKLKEEYKNYHGGILLIDEADAALFPAAQINLINFLCSFARKYDLQIVLTTHSPIIIEDVYQKSKHDKDAYRIIYLSDSHGPITCQENLSWEMIESDLLLKLMNTNKTIQKQQRINVYTEDDEAYDFLQALLYRDGLKKYIKIMPIYLGGENLIQLVQKKVPEFSEKSIICLDADKQSKKLQKYKNIIILPGNIPPDQFCFECLYNIDISDNFWNNDLLFTKRTLQNMPEYKKIHNMLDLGDIKEGELILGARIAELKKTAQFTKGTIREAFKTFYKSKEITQLMELNKTNPFHFYLKKHPDEKNVFCSLLGDALKVIIAKHSS